jgi:flagellar FliL protein
MSTPPTAAPDASAKSGGLKSHLPFIVALLAGLVVGGGAGAFVVGPALASGIAPAGAAAPRRVAHAEEEEPDEEAASDHGEGEEGAGEEEEGESGGGTHGGGEKGAETPTHIIDNLVLNPAESGGTRFLLLTVTFEVRNAAILEKMKARDAELRDAVLVTLGTKTVEQLADMTQREALKNELKAAAAKLFRKGSVRRIYFPQFVIQ